MTPTAPRTTKTTTAAKAVKATKSPKTRHRCTTCGTEAARWEGRCSGCGEWNTLVEERAAPATRHLRHASTSTFAPAAYEPAVAVRLAEVDLASGVATATTIDELDRVLGGGLVPGSVTLLGGEPGIGKSTLLLQVLAALARDGRNTLLVSAEESPQQVRLRAERLQALHPGMLLLAETTLPGVLDAVAEHAPDLLVVDSIQTVFDPDIGSAPGSVSQVRECAHQLVHVAKERGLTTVLVGHVTKEGALAGPRVLEHVVDTVLAFEGDRHHALRLLRAQKHRFGSTGELGLFEMTEQGLRGLPDPSGLFLGDRRPGASGSVVVPAMEGHRPLLVEMQALVGKTPYNLPKRSAHSLDPGRLGLILAVLEKLVGFGFADADVYATAVGGVRILDPGADLGVALAVASAAAGTPVAEGTVACGEIGLTGEVRQVSQMARRLAEAARLGFTDAIVPRSAPDGPPRLRLHRVPSLGHAIRAAGLRPVRFERVTARGDKSAAS